MIISGDPRLSPPLPLQPAPLPAAAVDIAHSFTALRRPRMLWDVRDNVLPWMVVPPLCFPVSIQLPRALGLDRLFDYRSPLSFLPLILGIGVFFVYLFALSRTFGASGPHLRIVADATGVTWSAQRFPRAEWQAPWAAARSFTVAPYVDVSGWGASGLVYTLDTDQGALSWLLVPYANAAARAEADTLTRLIVARTGLPLRDLEAWMTRIKAAGGQPECAARRGHAAGGGHELSGSAPSLAAALLALCPAGARRRLRRPVAAVAPRPLSGCPERVSCDIAGARPRTDAALPIFAIG